MTKINLFRLIRITIDDEAGDFNAKPILIH